MDLPSCVSCYVVTDILTVLIYYCKYLKFITFLTTPAQLQTSPHPPDMDVSVTGLQLILLQCRGMDINQNIHLRQGELRLTDWSQWLTWVTINQYATVYVTPPSFWSKSLKWEMYLIWQSNDLPEWTNTQSTAMDQLQEWMSALTPRMIDHTCSLIVQISDDRICTLGVWHHVTVLWRFISQWYQ